MIIVPVGQDFSPLQVFGLPDLQQVALFVAHVL